MVKSIGLVLILAAPVFSQDANISAERIRAQTRFLASDLLEGRGVGTRGGDLSTEYIATQLELAGVKPMGANGSYYQPVPLVGIETQPDTNMTATAGGKAIDFKFGEDYVGSSQYQQPAVAFDAGVVFVGHGISAPEFHWDDFKGVDVKDKVIVLFTNEPPSTDPRFFGGRALTYYGRWTYKYEEALRRGAKACLIIHTTPTASYGWDVVQHSWGHEVPFVKLDGAAKGLGFEGWLSREAGEKLLALAGRHVDELLAASEKADFHPIDLGMMLRMRVESKIRPLNSRNVVGVIPGSDPNLKDEAVIFSAHWDHFGIGEAVNGDNIYNGAIDNATGCATVLELARVWGSLPQKPKRSAVFLFVTAEEAGLLGSAYYGTHPMVPLSRTAIDLNYDALYPFGRAADVVIAGAERTTTFPQAQQIAKRLGLAISEDAQPEAGHYFRSDHFSLSKVGVPSFTIEHATEFAGKPAGYGKQMYQEYNSKHYHQPSDEFREDWDFTALQQAAEYGFLLGKDIANQEKLPDWKPGQEFHR
jgi:Zn-dependent M28 family amino/carboxypeptidase